MPLPPGFSEVSQTPSQAGSPPTGFFEPSSDVDWGGVVKDALNEARMGNGSKMRSLMTDPVTQAKALPYLLPAATAVIGMPWASTKGYVAGRGLSDAALLSYGRGDDIPSALSVDKEFPYIHGQVPELVGSAFSDLVTIPAIKSANSGKAIGQAEANAGLANVTKEAPPSGMRTAVKFVQNIKDKALTPEEARAMKPAIDTIFTKGWLNGTEYMSDLAKAKSNVMSVLNKIPGRAEPAQAMANAMKAPNMISKVWSSVPKSVKYGMGVGAGTVGAGDALYQVLKKIGIAP